MRLYYCYYFWNHFGLRTCLFDKSISAKVVIEPDPAQSPFVDGNHGIKNLKGTYSVEQSFEANHGLFEHINGLADRHLVDLGKLQWAVLDLDLHLGYLALTTFIFHHFDKVSSYYWKLGLMSPLVSHQIAQQFGPRDRQFVLLQLHLFITILQQRIVGWRR